MKPGHALAMALLLPLITTPIGLSGLWWGLPFWAACSLLATGVVALFIAAWMSRWWNRLADEAEKGDEREPAGR